MQIDRALQTAGNLHKIRHLPFIAAEKIQFLVICIISFFNELTGISLVDFFLFIRTMLTMTIFSQYLKNVDVPGIKYSKVSSLNQIEYNFLGQNRSQDALNLTQLYGIGKPQKTLTYKKNFVHIQRRNNKPLTI